MIGKIISHFMIHLCLQDGLCTVVRTPNSLQELEALRTDKSFPALGLEAGFSCQRTVVLCLKAL